MAAFIQTGVCNPPRHTRCARSPDQSIGEQALKMGVSIWFLLCVSRMLYVPVLSEQVIFDVLLRKGDLVEKFVAFANKPRLMQRFTERLAEYKGFWEGVQVSSKTWLQQVGPVVVN